ncbi:MAG: hypothetical protein KDA24_05720 [Deltaproteobacteria bacterium]|nr:hypothetical protein [Deltaproteobacteria bacterium]
MKEPSLGRSLIDALKEGASGEVVVERAGLRARARVAGAGLYGSELEGLTVETETRGLGGRPARTERVVHGLAERLDYLGEPLEALEITPSHGRGQLRTRRDRVRDGEYFELDVQDGDRVDVGRVRYDREAGERRKQTRNTGHGVLRRLVDDLAELIDNADSPTQD